MRRTSTTRFLGVSLIGLLVLLPAQAQHSHEHGQGHGAHHPSHTAPATAGDLKVTLQSPHRLQVGKSRISFRVSGAKGEPITGAKIAASATMPGMNMKPVKAAVTEAGKGNYTATLDLDMAGSWRVALQVERPGQRPHTHVFDLAVSK